ncbi:MAG TPA: glycosyltransferase [Chitinophagaceae bacterium]|jgi:GT2 family glycosyltransferase|nr:glycosyltransferase [Chitinophagaceae bacterium]
MTNHSFAVMAYKDSPYLHDCLDSLKVQTVESEIYISTSTPSVYIDETAKKYGIKIFTTEPGQGIAHDWNFSLRVAKTKYVTLAHQDDLYDKRYSELCVKAAEKFNDALICFTGYSEIVDGRERTSTLMLTVKKFMNFMFMPFKKNIKSKAWKKFCQSFGTAIPCPSVMYNKETLGDFKFSEKYKVSLDWDAWLRMAEMKGRFVYVPRTLSKHRIHKASATTEGIEGNVRQQEDFEIYCRIWPKFIAKLLLKFYAGSYKSNNV